MNHRLQHLDVNEADSLTHGGLVDLAIGKTLVEVSLLLCPHERHDELEEDQAAAPDVGGRRVLTALKNLWRHVHERTADGVLHPLLKRIVLIIFLTLLRHRVDVFGESEVGQLRDDPIRCMLQQNVLRLDVAMDNVAQVQLLHGLADLVHKPLCSELI